MIKISASGQISRKHYRKKANRGTVIIIYIIQYTYVSIFSVGVDFRQCTCIPVHVLAQSMCGIRTTILCRDEFIRYRIAVCDAKSKFCDAKLNVIHRKLRCKAILTVQKNVVCVRFPCLHECMHLRTGVPVCAVRSKIVRNFFLFVCIMSMRGALDSCYFPHMPYACCFLDFRVRRFDNKLQVAFDSVRCWFVEVLLTS